MAEALMFLGIIYAVYVGFKFLGALISFGYDKTVKEPEERKRQLEETARQIRKDRLERKMERARKRGEDAANRKHASQS